MRPDEEREMAMVTCEGLTKTYRQGTVSVPALRGVDLTVAAGEFTALAGPSGSGKTTLLNLVGGLDRPDDGTIVVAGRAYAEMTDSAMADLRLHHIGFVFQAYNLIPVLSAVENVEYVMLLQGVPARERRERATAILDEVGLEGRCDHRPAALSGGQQQRVAVARAIVSEPSIVLADEPTANLDSRTGADLLEMMREMNERRGVTFIFSTHDPQVMTFARRLVRIQDGRVVADERKASA
jgi:putative ABC transport system ATP-binding protein